MESVSSRRGGQKGAEERRNAGTGNAETGNAETGNAALFDHPVTA